MTSVQPRERLARTTDPSLPKKKRHRAIGSNDKLWRETRKARAASWQEREESEREHGVKN